MPRIEQGPIRPSPAGRSEPLQESLDLTALFFQTTKRYSEFTPEEERDAFRQFSDGVTEVHTMVSDPSYQKDPLAFDTDLRRAIDSVKQIHESIVLHNIGLVIAVAEKNPSSLPLIDRIQNGNIGLLEAIEEFDPDQGYRFSTFAVWGIKNAVINRSRDEVNHIHIPTSKVEQKNTLQKFRDSFERIHGRLPTDEESRAALKWKKSTFDEVIQAKSVNQKIDSLEELLTDDTSSDPRGDFIPDPVFADAHSVEGLLYAPNDDQRKQLYDAFHVISESNGEGLRDVSMFIAHFSYPELSMDQLAKDFGCSKTEVEHAILCVKKQIHELIDIPKSEIIFRIKKRTKNAEAHELKHTGNPRIPFREISHETLDAVESSMTNGYRKISIYRKHVIEKRTLQEIGNEYGEITRQRVLHIIEEVEKAIQNYREEK